MTAPRPFSSCLRRRAARWIAVGVSGVAWALAAVPAARRLDIGVLDANSSQIYRYMNFDQIEDYKEVADTVAA